MRSAWSRCWNRSTPRKWPRTARPTPTSRSSIESKVQAKALATEAHGAGQFARQALRRPGHFLPHAVAGKDPAFDRGGDSQILESGGGRPAEQPDGRERRRIATASSAIFWTWRPRTNRNAPSWITKRSAAAACWPNSPTPARRRRKSSMPFNCSICGEESTRICVWCTKDTCANHLCAKCGRCSDCCECEVPLDEPVHGPGT